MIPARATRGVKRNCTRAGTAPDWQQRIVDALLMNAPEATSATKLRSLEVAGAMVGDAMFAELVREHAATRQRPEAAEGLASFREKRNPGWYPAAT